MNRERAESHLRQLAEAELRRARTLPAVCIPGRWLSARLALTAQALSAVGAVEAGTADEIQANFELAIAVHQASPGQRGLPADARMRLARLMRRPPRRTASEAFPVSGLSTGHAQPAPRRASWRVVPVGQVIKVRGREVLFVAYVRSADGARFVVADWPFGPFTATAADDRGVSYQVSWRGELAARELLLRPDPPHQIRRLYFTTATGEPAIRIDLNPQIPAPDVAVTRSAHSPGELLLDVIAARMLTTAALFSQNNPGQPAAANACLRAFAVGGPGHVVAALHVADMLPLYSPVPGQLAGLCARLGIDGHGITAPPGGDLPQRWQSMLTPPSRSEPQAPPAPRLLAATVAELPELDGAQIAIAGLHHGERGTIMHLLASGVTLEDDWAYARGIRPMPVLWVHDSDGHWHATRTDGVSPKWGDTGVVMVWLRIVPPLEPGTAWIDVAATGRSAEARTRLPLSWS
jgi:hypothetical protein